ncbi:hypothetical protein NDU88_003503 [Pleurodeles waltl]|uniref:Uncharacterized protein n=1 Tax=Pleurodeles waltl TaxID=8319 RepID=A0AAV7M4H8_PLEWA|nr:hypothetical protein NDU88_003503 [Pleurodeles waltl]
MRYLGPRGVLSTSPGMDTADAPTLQHGYTIVITPLALHPRECIDEYRTQSLSAHSWKETRVKPYIVVTLQTTTITEEQRLAVSHMSLGLLLGPTTIVHQEGRLRVPYGLGA